MSARLQAESFPGRSFYKASGVVWTRFLPWLLPAFAVAMGLAALMAFLFRVGHYYIFIVPLVLALCVAGMITLAVGRGHCRSKILGGLAGFGAGVVLYMGYFFFGMIHDFGPEVAKHPELLPSYIRLRMAVEITRDIHDSRDQGRPTRPGDVYMNWGRFTLEWAFILGILTAAGVKRARKPYCNSCRRWMLREVTQFDPAHTPELLEAFQTHSARPLAMLSAKAPFTTIPNVSLAVDYCPTLKDGITLHCPAYVSIKSINAAPANMVRDPFEQSKGKPLLAGMQLNHEELAALAPRFPVLETVTGHSAVQALLPREVPRNSAGNKGFPCIEITPLPEACAGKIMTRKTIWMGNALSLVVLIGFFGGMGLLLWGGVTAFPDNPPVDGVSPAAKSFGILLMVFGGAWFCISLGVALFDNGILANRYLRKLLHREFARRSSLLVEPGDPEAFFVEVVPKLNWGKMMLENASDIGLLVVDGQRRELRFEGDKEQWRIPAAALLSCQIEEYVHQQGTASTSLYYTVLRANHPNGFWEAPIRERKGTGLLSKRQRKTAEKLFQAIKNMCSVNENTLTAV